MSSFHASHDLESPQPKPLVCIVDDDVSVRRALSRILVSSDYAVEAFESADGYLDRPCSAALPACLLLDIHMPGQSGLALCQQLASSGNVVPIILVTAYADMNTSACRTEAGAYDLLTKPLDADKLLMAVERAIRQSTAPGNSSSNVAP